MQESIDRAAFRSLTSGLYVISSTTAEGRRCGCVVNTLLQVASSPAQLLVSLNKDNATTKAILEAGRFAATVLSQEATMELIGIFGFRSSNDTEKFENIGHDSFEGDIPYLTEKGVASFLVKVDSQVDVGTHIVFVGTVERANVLSRERPLTYSYYHEVLRGKTPKNAASFNPEEAAANEAAPPTPNASPAAASDDAAATNAVTPKVGWRCSVCGYIVEGYPDGLPEDFTCPICQMGREFFERIEL